MCGIAGLLGAFPDGAEQIRPMTRRLTHRGPDQEGYYTHAPSRLHLGHRRLSILDLSEEGRQPMVGEGLAVVFNGEIYNFLELRRLLEPQARFRSRSDTEVLLHGYRAWGVEGLLQRLRGMFAFALFDEALGRLFLARDRFGEKPLFLFSDHPERFAFASELRALGFFPQAREIDPESLDLYFTFGYVPAPRALVKHVSKLAPGHLMEVDVATLRRSVRPYWSLDPCREKRPVAVGEALEQVEGLLRRSVDNSLHSDVPLGIFLSGGVDSGCVAACARASKGSDLQTFSVIYDDPSFDESRHARLAARHLGTRHHELNIRVDDAKGLITQLHRLVDEPMSDMSLVPTHLLSRLTREHVTVALGGDGADELFIGYPTHPAHRLAGFYAALPGWMRRGVQGVVQRLPVSHTDFSLEFRLKRFTASALMEPMTRHFSWQAHVPLESRAELYGGQGPDSLALMRGFLEGHLPPGTIPSLFHLVEWLDLTLYLPNDILCKVDTAAMATSLEVRAPFLDADLAEYVHALPESMKYRLFTQKYLLKKLAERWLPRKLVHRRKHGFGIPLGRWLKEDLHDYAAGLLDPRHLSALPGIDPHYGRRLLAEHRSGQRDHRKPLWSLMVLTCWMLAHGQL